MTADSKLSGNEDVVRHFDRQAASYRDQSETGLWQFLRRHEASAVVEMMEGIEGHSFLDLGCGAGYYASLFNGRGAEDTHAVDFSEAMIKQLPADIHGHIGNIATCDLGRQFSRIVCAGALEFVDDPAAVFRNARRHANKDARFVVLVPHANLLGRIYRRYHRRHDVPVRLFTLPDIRKLAGETGWQVERSIAVFPFALIAGLRLSPS